MQVNILLFNDFETLDAFGPVEVLGRVKEYELRYVSMAGGIIRSRQNTPVMTEKLSPNEFSGLILVPGGQGTRPLVSDDAFISLFKEAAVKSKYCLTVCTGSALLAKTGLLDGKKATSNKIAFDWVRSINDKVLWQKKARWIADGKYYTSGGVSAGTDMALGFVADRFGREKALEITRWMEYIWHENNDEKAFFC